MTKGLLTMKWDERSGVEILTKFPDDIEVNDMTLMQIYSQHEYNQESGVISLRVGDTNLLSYYSGAKKGIYIILLLSPDEDPDDYESGLINASQMIMQNLKDDKYKSMITFLYSWLSVYAKFTSEQFLALLYNDEVKRLILNRLRDEGLADKSELRAWLNDKYRRSYVDVDAAVIELIRTGIIKETSVKGKGVPSVILILIGDLKMYRKPPFNILENPKEKGLPEKYINEYRSRVKDYFNNYFPSDEDNLKIINIFVQPQNYEIIKFLREKIATSIDLEGILGDQAYNIENIVKELVKNDIIINFESKDDIEYYALLSDFFIDQYFPKYTFNIIKLMCEQKSISKPVLIEYLNVLEQSYFEKEFSE
ncbi:MAG: hypothetical protein ACTSQJ_12690 [Promethearchaeota archaeon]